MPLSQKQSNVKKKKENKYIFYYFILEKRQHDNVELKFLKQQIKRKITAKCWLNQNY